jgi:hypothetical protein
MFEHESVLRVTCSPSAAFDHIARGFFEHHGIWDPTVKGMEKTSTGPMGAGTTGVERRQMGPWAIASEFEITAFQPDTAFGFRTLDGPMIEEAHWAIAPEGAGTSVHQRLKLTPASPVLRAIEPVMRPMFARNVRVNTGRLRAALNELA